MHYSRAFECNPPAASRTRRARFIRLESIFRWPDQTRCAERARRTNQ